MTADLLTSARRETPWARALTIALRRHGPTPIYDAVAHDLDYQPQRTAS